MASETKTAQSIYDSLPQAVTFSDIQKHGGPRATALRRWLRDNLDAYVSRTQSRTVLDKVKDKELIMMLLSRVGSARGGFTVPNAQDNDAMLAGIQGIKPAPSAASVQGNAHAETPGEKSARVQAAAQDRRQGQGS